MKHLLVIVLVLITVIIAVQKIEQSNSIYEIEVKEYPDSVIDSTYNRQMSFRNELY